ncbi:aldehyde dehydrogenase [Dactylosporangium sp. NPDC005555]|uniref:aldehyde dehydrogenase family protein n=1 Tax=Dactylosporangium sp. NPDC005555 TaxID=3154889 RepID=UPI0033A481FB
MTARSLVGGGWKPATRTLPGTLEDPATGAVLGPRLGSSRDDVEAALAAADRAATPWASVPPPERADLLDACADALEARVADIVAVESASTGVPIRQATPLGFIVTGSFRLAAAQLREGWLTRTATRDDGRAVTVELLPWGPALCLVPWNAPAPMTAHKAANALAAGCPTIVKPSEYAPAGTQLLVETIAELLPAGALQLLHGGAEVGAALVGDPRVRAVSFTGGVPGGRAVAGLCAAGLKPAQLELGGNNPLVVLPDADVDAAARAAVDLLTTLNGQWCRALGRLIAPHDMVPALLAAIGERLSALRAGDPADPATELGPLIHSGHRALVAARMLDLGGKAHTFTDVPGGGNFFAPALVTGAAEEPARHEIFGPVATVHGYGTVDEAVALANDTAYGLEGYVFGTDEDAALGVARRIRAGEVKVNGSSVMSLHLFTPRPAWGVSGLGEEGTAETLRFFTNPRVTGVENGFAL